MVALIPGLTRHQAFACRWAVNEVMLHVHIVALAVCGSELGVQARPCGFFRNNFIGCERCRRRLQKVPGSGSETAKWRLIQGVPSGFRDYRRPLNLREDVWHERCF